MLLVSDYFAVLSFIIIVNNNNTRTIFMICGKTVCES